MDRIIGREYELSQLDKCYRSTSSQFVTLYGRRRVGKTSLVRYYFKDSFDFHVTGVLEGSREDQEGSFYDALVSYGYRGERPTGWKGYLKALAGIIDTKKRKKRCVVFIDELPCFDTENSGFLKEFSLFWNSKASWYDNLMLVVCGSATSWMIRNIVDSKGGLHNRQTHEIHLAPFNLYTTEQYFKAHKCKWDRLSILQIYMALGGIPYYLSLLDFDRSVADNIDRLFFLPDAELAREYKRLYHSLYRNPERYMNVIRLLASHRNGLTRNEISASLKIPTGTGLTNLLDDLVYCDFIRKYSNGGKRNSSIYQIVDLYTIFYLTFCTGTITDRAYWKHTINTPTQNSWCGLSFERVCLIHIWEIIQSMHLDVILTECYAWRSKTSVPGAQIDMIIDRADGIVNVCEMKYSRTEYRLDQDEYGRLLNRVDAFQHETGTRSAIQPVLITTFGNRRNTYSDFFSKVLTLNDLFVRNEEND